MYTFPNSDMATAHGTRGVYFGHDGRHDDTARPSVAQWGGQGCTAAGKDKSVVAGIDLRCDGRSEGDLLFFFGRDGLLIEERNCSLHQCSNFDRRDDD